MEDEWMSGVDESNDHLIQIIVIAQKRPVMTLAEKMHNYFLVDMVGRAYMIVKRGMKRPK
jgi:hypothetical protein